MPLPKPRAHETEQEYVSRCIRQEYEHGYPTPQAAAMCYRKFRGNPRVPVYRISLVREKSANIEYEGQVFNSGMAASIFRKFFEDTDREIFAVLTLDTKNKIIGYNVVSIGSLSQSVVHPRETIKMAILQNAAAMIHGHNHPSGDPTPSQEDRDTHKRLEEAGKIMGIKILDGIVIGLERYYSFAEGGQNAY